MNKLSMHAALMALAVTMMPVSVFAAAPESSNGAVSSDEAYVSSVFDKLKTNWVQQASGNRLANGSLTFILNDDGTLSASHLETGLVTKGSGQEMLEFLKKSAPFGAFPQALKGSKLEFRFRTTPNSLQMVGHRVLNTTVARSESPVTMTPGLLMMAVANPSRTAMVREQGSHETATVSQTLGRVDEALGMEAYITGVQEKVKEKWQLPQDYAFRRVVADIMIDRDGSLMSAMLKESSGDKAVDKAALKAIQEAAPFARVPATAKSLPVQIEYIFDPVQMPQTEALN